MNQEIENVFATNWQLAGAFLAAAVVGIVFVWALRQLAAPPVPMSAWRGVVGRDFAPMRHDPIVAWNALQEGDGAPQQLPNSGPASIAPELSTLVGCEQCGALKPWMTMQATSFGFICRPGCAKPGKAAA